MNAAKQREDNWLTAFEASPFTQKILYLAVALTIFSAVFYEQTVHLELTDCHSDLVDNRPEMVCEEEPTIHTFIKIRWTDKWIQVR